MKFPPEIPIKYCSSFFPFLVFRPVQCDGIYIIGPSLPYIQHFLDGIPCLAPSPSMTGSTITAKETVPNKNASGTRASSFPCRSLGYFILSFFWQGGSHHRPKPTAGVNFPSSIPALRKPHTRQYEACVSWSKAEPKKKGKQQIKD